MPLINTKLLAYPGFQDEVAASRRRRRRRRCLVGWSVGREQRQEFDLIYGHVADKRTTEISLTGSGPCLVRSFRPPTSTPSPSIKHGSTFSISLSCFNALSTEHWNHAIASLHRQGLPSPPSSALPSRDSVTSGHFRRTKPTKVTCAHDGLPELLKPQTMPR